MNVWEALFIALGRPTLTEQIDLKKLLLFRNSVMWQCFFLLHRNNDLIDHFYLFKDFDVIFCKYAY